MEIKNVQIYPAKKRLVPNVKLVKVISNLSARKYNRAINGVQRSITEKRNHKKYGEVLTTYKISNAEGYDNTDPLTEFDRAVLSVCVSEFADGNNYTTLAIILRGLTGKTRQTSNGAVNASQREAILTSVRKLMCTVIEIDDTKTNEQLGYEATTAESKCSTILPAFYVERTVNGQDATVIYFDRVSPLMEIAEKRNQILRFDPVLLDVPKMQNTQMNITVKNYAMCRVMEIKQHHMTPTITFDDLFQKCRITDANRKIKHDARETAVAFFQHLVNENFITSFELVKKRNKFYSVTFTY